MVRERPASREDKVSLLAIALAIGLACAALGLIVPSLGLGGARAPAKATPIKTQARAMADGTEIGQGGKWVGLSEPSLGQSALLSDRPGEWVAVPPNNPIEARLDLPRVFSY